MKSTAITLKQLSFLSGFSVSTVSKALNNKTDISEVTRVTIKNMAEQHNYVPNSYAVSLRGKSPKCIAVILPKVTESCYSNALFHIQKIADEKDYRVLLYQSFNDKTKEESYLRSLNDGSTRGTILITKSEDKASDIISEFPHVHLSVSENCSLTEIEKKCEFSFNEILK